MIFFFPDPSRPERAFIPTHTAAAVWSCCVRVFRVRQHRRRRVVEPPFFRSAARKKSLVRRSSDPLRDRVFRQPVDPRHGRHLCDPGTPQAPPWAVLLPLSAPTNCRLDGQTPTIPVFGHKHTQTEHRGPHPIGPTQCALTAGTRTTAKASKWPYRYAVNRPRLAISPPRPRAILKSQEGRKRRALRRRADETMPHTKTTHRHTYMVVYVLIN